MHKYRQDIGPLLGCPLTASPLSLAHINGSTDKIDRAKVPFLTENMVESGNMYMYRQQYRHNCSGLIVSATYPPESPKYM